MQIGQVLTILISAFAGLLGVGLGGWIANRNDKARRRAEFLNRQLSEFYGPLLSLRAETNAKGELRDRLSSIASEQWQNICAEYEGASPQAKRDGLSERYDRFGKMIEYDNGQLRTALMPAYREMLSVFRDRMWLSEPETRRYFSTLVEFVEIWERFLSETIPREVLVAVEHSEKKLIPFYDHVERKVDSRRQQLSEVRR
ncbi:MAG TPA: hypothetical protein VGB91_00150 [Rhizomicrobium sp.]